MIGNFPMTSDKKHKKVTKMKEEKKITVKQVASKRLYKLNIRKLK